jgi:hypothetical protein
VTYHPPKIGEWLLYRSNMALLKRLVVGGLRVYKPKIQATKPKDTGKMVADGVVVSLPSAVLSVESAQTPAPRFGGGAGECAATGRGLRLDNTTTRRGRIAQ